MRISGVGGYEMITAVEREVVAHAGCEGGQDIDVTVT